jgi:hypothetical protein
MEHGTLRPKGRAHGPQPQPPLLSAAAPQPPMSSCRAMVPGIPSPTSSPCPTLAHGPHPASRPQPRRRARPHHSVPYAPTKAPAPPQLCDPKRTDERQVECMGKQRSELIGERLRAERTILRESVGDRLLWVSSSCLK